MPTIDTRKYARGTYTVTAGPWSTFVKARAVCPDGKARTVKLAPCADTFFSVPAKLSYRNKTVCGFISFASEDGMSTDPDQWVKFTPTGRHARIFDTVEM